jgi:hypothetical protein
MYIDGYVKSSTRECQQLGALGMRQQFNTQNRHGLNPECASQLLMEIIVYANNLQNTFIFSVYFLIRKFILAALSY